jgi:hypothetical protein
MAEQDKIKFKYVGSGGEFLNNIPARDLTEDDWERLTKEQQKMVTVSLLYKDEVAHRGQAKTKAEANKEEQ